jgi:hypothetical protein
MRKPSTVLKERLKALRKNRGNDKIIESLTVDEEISDLKSRIKVCEQDLLNPSFSNNLLIMGKIRIMRERILKLEESKVITNEVKIE